MLEKGPLTITRIYDMKIDSSNFTKTNYKNNGNHHMQVPISVRGDNINLDSSTRNKQMEMEGNLLI